MSELDDESPESVKKLDEKREKCVGSHLSETTASAG
jgi:hypothetical protein